jgi:hypothetical protein
MNQDTGADLCRPDFARFVALLINTGERPFNDIASHRGFALASSATLNRLELGAQFSDRYRKIAPREGKAAEALLELGVRCLPKDSELIVLDFDATDDPLHGRQEGRFFHAYYAHYCYLPLCCFCGEVCLWAQLRTSARDASDGTREALEVIVAAIRQRLPRPLSSYAGIRLSPEKS